MNRNRRYDTARGGLVTVAVLCVLAIGGCAVVDEAVSAVTRDAVRNSSYAREMRAMSSTMMFNVLYSQVFLMGGYSIDHEEYEEGQGTTWKIASTGDDESSFIAEKALLRINDDGSMWWRLRYDAEDLEEEEEILYEYLVDRDYTVRKVRFRDRETGHIQEYVPEADDAGEADGENRTTVAESDREEGEREEASLGSEERGDIPALTPEEYARFSQGIEQVTVGAGSFEAEKLVYDFRDEEGSEHIVYEWWMVDDVPGKLVKYRWRNEEDDSSLVGELVEVRSGYTSELASF